MFIKLLITLFIALIVVESIDSNKILPTYKEWADSIHDILEEDQILTDYLSNWKPLGSFEIKYSKADYTMDEPAVMVELGNYLSPSQTEEQPIDFTFKSFFPLNKHFKKDLYSITLTDLDSSADGVVKYEKCHSIWQNLKFNEDNYEIIQNKEDKASFETSFDLTNLTSSQDLMEYNGPAPKPFTGSHRYVFTLFKQPYGKLPDHKLKFRERWGSRYEGHGVEDWANYYGLEPLSVNFFISSNED